MDWCWTQPVDGPRLLVLLALAKRVKPETDQAAPSMPELAALTGLSETTVRGHIQALAKDKVIKVVVSNGGRHQRSVYTLTGVLTPRKLWGSKPLKTPQEPTPKNPMSTPRIPRKNPPAAAPVVLRTNREQEVVREAFADANTAQPDTSQDGLFGEPVTPASMDRKRIKVAQAIANRYCELEPMSKYVNVLGIVRRPLESGRFSGEMVMAAVERLAQESRTLTLETLRVELVGFTPRSNGSPRNGRVPLRERLSGGAA